MRQNIFVVPFPLFLATSTISLPVVVFVSAFVMASTIWSVSGLLFLTICKSGGTCPADAPQSRRHWSCDVLRYDFAKAENIVIQ